MPREERARGVIKNIKVGAEGDQAYLQNVHHSLPVHHLVVIVLSHQHQKSERHEGEEEDEVRSGKVAKGRTMVVLIERVDHLR